MCDYSGICHLPPVCVCARERETLLVEPSLIMQITPETNQQRALHISSARPPQVTSAPSKRPEDQDLTPSRLI